MAEIREEGGHRVHPVLQTCGVEAVDLYSREEHGREGGMSKWRRAAKVDANQPDIVKALRKMPGVSVEVGHDDIIVGYRGLTYWYEIKEPGTVCANGEIRESAKKPSQRKLEAEWTGHYRIITSIDDILSDIMA